MSVKEERLIFDSSVRQLFDSLPQAVSSIVAGEWQALGLEIDRLLPGYPVDVWWAAIDSAAAHFEGDRTARLRLLGRGLTQRFSHSVLGKAVGPLGRLTGTRRALLRSPITFRSGNNYLTTVVEIDEPQRVRLRINEASPVAELLAGSIEEMVTYTGGKQVQVVVTIEAKETLYDVSWQ